MIALFPLPPGAEAALFALSWLSIVLAASKHAYHYAHTNTPKANRDWTLRYCEVHFTQVWYEGALCVGIMLAGMPLLSILALYWTARLPFQLLILKAYNLRLRDEPDQYAVDVFANGNSRMIRKRFGGLWRVLVFGLGAAVLVLRLLLPVHIILT